LVRAVSTELEVAVQETKRLAAALEATCRREEAQRPVVLAALAWKAADDAFAEGKGPPPVRIGALDGLRIAVQIYQDQEGLRP
jgi:hypothetical protein